MHPLMQESVKKGFGSQDLTANRCSIVDVNIFAARPIIAVLFKNDPTFGLFVPLPLGRNFQSHNIDLGHICQLIEEGVAQVLTNRLGLTD